MRFQRRRARTRLVRARFSRKFPADSLFIREFGPERSSILTAHTASRSSMPETRAPQSEYSRRNGPFPRRIRSERPADSTREAHLRPAFSGRHSCASVLGADLAGDIENAALRLPGQRQFHAHEAIDVEVPRLLAEQDSLGDALLNEALWSAPI